MGTLIKTSFVREKMFLKQKKDILKLAYTLVWGSKRLEFNMQMVL